MIGKGPNKAKPIRDRQTGTEYRSMYQAGKALASSFQLDPSDQLVFYKIRERAAGRFETRNARGEWVSLNDPSVEGYTPVAD